MGYFFEFNGCYKEITLDVSTKAGRNLEFEPQNRIRKRDF